MTAEHYYIESPTKSNQTNNHHDQVNETSTSKLRSPSAVSDIRLTSCGFGSWRPKWLQVFANPVAFLVNICFVAVIQGMAGSMIFSTLNTLEKRYAFDSKISALILIADNISGLILSPLVGYYSVRYNRSRMIGFGEITLALSCIASAFPYFIYGPATHLIQDESLLSSAFASNRTHFEMCTVHDFETDCRTGKGATVWPAVIILIAANFVRGIGFTMFYVIATPYMDDNVSKKNSPIFISIMQTVLLIGPAAGFFVSSFFLRLYEDPWNDPGLSRTDPRFVGAWWLGYLTMGVLLLIAALPMLLFPMQFKTASVKAKVIKNKMKESGGTKNAFKRFVKNPMIIIYFLGNTCRYFGIGGYYTFNAKYIESQYRQSSATASLITGSASIMPISIGIITGGMFVAWYRPKSRFLLIFVFLAEFISIFTIGGGILLGCEPINLQGEQVSSTGAFSLNAGCNSNCDCSTKVFTPVCGPDSSTTYFSPCHAGCDVYNPLNSTFESCNCFDGSATKGYCPGDVSCGNLPYYLAAIVTGAIISSTAKTGNQLITYRAVEPMDKGFTAGLMGAMLSIFAFIPFPIIYGHIADSSCLVWERKCGKTGNCWIYDQAKFRNRLHTVTIIFMMLGSLFDFILIFYADRLTNLYDDDDTPAAESVTAEPPEKQKFVESNEMKTIQHT